MGLKAWSSVPALAHRQGLVLEGLAVSLLSNLPGRRHHNRSTTSPPPILGTAQGVPTKLRPWWSAIRCCVQCPREGAGLWWCQRRRQNPPLQVSNPTLIASHRCLFFLHETAKRRAPRLPNSFGWHKPQVRSVTRARSSEAELRQSRARQIRNGSSAPAARSCDTLGWALELGDQSRGRGSRAGGGGCRVAARVAKRRIVLFGHVCDEY